MTNPKKSSPGGAISSISSAFIKNESAIKRFLRRFLYKSEDIDEIAQETFLRAYQATSGREIDSPKAYIFQVARTLAYNELARKTRKLTDYLEEATEQDTAGTEALEEELSAQQRVGHYFEAIAELPPRCRKVFLMRKVQAMSHRDIAANLGISISAVEKHIARGVESCKRSMEQRDHKANTQGAARDKHAAEGTAPTLGGQSNDR